MAALSSIVNGTEWLFERIRVCEASKSKLEASYKSSKIKLSDAQQHEQELEHTRDTVEQLVTNMNKAEKALSASQENYRILKMKLQRG